MSIMLLKCRLAHPGNFLSKLVEEKESHHSDSMTEMNFIDISSSDDDLESWETDGWGSTSSRVLPEWASTRGTNSSTTGSTNIINYEFSRFILKTSLYD